MIRRDAGDGGFWLITQHDHALAAGELARRFGNGVYARPQPAEAVIAGVASHDAGWPLHDERPTVNQDGLPLHVFEAPVGLATRVWSASVERARAAAGDYAGLLVSLHVFNLSALNVMHHSANPSRPDLFEINKFQHRQIEVQEELRRRVGVRTDVPLQLGLAAPGASAEDDQLMFNFRVLTAMDRLSLALCCGKNLFPRMEDVRPRPGAGAVPITVTMDADGATMTLTPWPFDAADVEIEVPARRVGRGPYASDEALGEAYGRAPVEGLRLRWRRG